MIEIILFFAMIFSGASSATLLFYSLLGVFINFINLPSIVLDINFKGDLFWIFIAGLMFLLVFLYLKYRPLDKIL